MKIEDLKRKMPEIFEKIKRDVYKIVRRRRAGLSLGLEIILEEQPYDIVWAYTYHLLLHEYIHSLGIYDEAQCRAVTLKITEEIFNDADHPAIILAQKGIGTYFPNLQLIYAPPELQPDGLSIEYIAGFDKQSYDYYS